MTTPIKPQPHVGFFFCNHYMLGIHGGIQSLHAAVQMAVDFPPGRPGHDVFHAWATSGEPIAILLNAGFASRLERVARAIEVFNQELAATGDTVLPYARFHEGVDELNGALTAVSLVIPSKWGGSKYDCSPDELKAALEMGDPVDIAPIMNDWTMGDRLRLLRHGMPLRT